MLKIKPKQRAQNYVCVIIVRAIAGASTIIVCMKCCRLHWGGQLLRLVSKHKYIMSNTEVLENTSIDNLFCRHNYPGYIIDFSTQVPTESI